MYSTRPTMHARVMRRFDRRSACEGDKVKVHQLQWLAGGYDLEIRHF